MSNKKNISGCNRGSGFCCLALFFCLALAPAQEKTTPTSLDLYQKLLAEWNALPRGNGAPAAREKLLRRWFVKQEAGPQAALRKFILQRNDHGGVVLVLGFLAQDLPGILEDGGEKSLTGKIFLEYFNDLVVLNDSVALKARDLGEKLFQGKALEEREATLKAIIADSGGRLYRDAKRYLDSRELVALSLAAIDAFPLAVRGERLTRILKNHDHPYLLMAIGLIGRLRDLSLAQQLRPFLELPKCRDKALASLHALTFVRFTSPDIFDKWWAKNRNFTWEQVRDMYVQRNLHKQPKAALQRAVAEGVRKQKDKYLPLVRDLVKRCIQGNDWTQPLLLIKDQDTCGATLKGLVAAKPRLVQVPGGNQGKAFIDFFDELIRLSKEPPTGLNGDLYVALSFLAEMQEEPTSLRSRSLTCLAARAAKGREADRLQALALLKTFPGGEADRKLLAILCEPALPPRMLGEILGLLKVRSLDFSDQAALRVSLTNVQARMTVLLGDDKLSPGLRNNAILFISQWLPGLALPFLQKILLHQGGLGARLDDRKAAAVALQDTVRRQKKNSAVVWGVTKIFLDGLALSAPGNKDLAAVRMACAQKLERTTDVLFECLKPDPQLTHLVTGLGAALDKEDDPGSVKALITALLKLGTMAGQATQPALLAQARKHILSRVGKSQAGQAGKMERDRLFKAINKLCLGLDSRIRAARAFAAAKDRDHALTIYFGVLHEKKDALLEQALKVLAGNPAGGATALPGFLREYLAVLLFGRPLAETVLGAQPLGLSRDELADGLQVIRRLHGYKLKDWGRREDEWFAHLSWFLARAKKQAGEKLADEFALAVLPLKALLRNKSLSPQEKLTVRLRLGESLLETKDYIGAEVTLRSLLKDVPGQAYPLLARALEAKAAAGARDEWYKAANAWFEYGRLQKAGALTLWEARLAQVDCYLKAKDKAQAGKTLDGFRAEKRPATGVGWGEINKRLAALEKILPAPVKPKAPAKPAPKKPASSPLTKATSEQPEKSPAKPANKPPSATEAKK